MGREFLKANQLRSTFLSEGAGGARKLGSAARRRNIGAVCSSLKASAKRVFRSFWIFNRRDHGGLLQITGEPGKAVQYDIGNLRTVSRMTQHRCRPRSPRRCASCCARTELAARPSNATGVCRSLDSSARNALTGSRAPIGHQSRARAGQAAS